MKQLADSLNATFGVDSFKAAPVAPRSLFFLEISWSTSRGRDTYGYNICRLDDTSFRGKRYRCNGGGCDMIGTVIGDWLEDKYQDRLLAIKDRFLDYGQPKPADALYGGFYGKSGKVSLDGACGIGSMERIAEAIGLTFKWVGDKKGRTIGYMVTDSIKQEQAA